VQQCISGHVDTLTAPQPELHTFGRQPCRHLLLLRQIERHCFDTNLQKHFFYPYFSACFLKSVLICPTAAKITYEIMVLFYWDHMVHFNSALYFHVL
jgi:hypothetical protein